MERIDQEIENRLLDQSGISLNHHRAGARIEPQLNVAELGLRREKIHQLLEDRVQVHPFLAQLQLTGEAEKIIEDIAKAGRLAADGAKPRRQTAVRRIGRIQIFLQQLQ